MEILSAHENPQVKHMHEDCGHNLHRPHFENASSGTSNTIADRRKIKSEDPLTMKREVSARIPTKNGECTVYLYKSSRHPDKEHMAFVYGSLDKLQQGALTRVHSECFTGEVIGSLRCDCQEQLHTAQELVAKKGGVIVYLRQEGRGIGLTEKLKAYNLQDQGLDTVDANLALGHQADSRTYDEAALILKDLGVQSISLLTNNTEKLQKLAHHGVNVVKRVPMMPKTLTPDNLAYLRTKVERMDHMLKLSTLSLSENGDEDEDEDDEDADENNHNHNDEDDDYEHYRTPVKNFGKTHEKGFDKASPVAQPAIQPVPQNYFF